jgi:bifunctional isochorismate lyase/aryl carrier protein
MSIPKIAAYALPPQSQWPLPRTDWLPSSQRAVLLIHDMQDYFVQFYDRTAQPMPEVIAHIQQLRQACQNVGIPIVYTAQPAVQALPDRALLQDWWGPGITAQPDQASVIADLTPTPQDVVLTKWRYSAFARSDLQDRMRAWGRDQLIVCGVYAHIGCMTTCVDAFMRDIQPFLIGDAVADFSAAEHLQALNWTAGRCGIVMSTQHAVQQLQAPARPVYASIDALHQAVATLLDVPPHELDVDDNLIDMGLDSIRLMALVTQWREAGRAIDFVQLGERPRISAWWALLS